MNEFMPKTYEFVLFTVVIVLLLYGIIRLEMLISSIKYQQLLKDLRRTDKGEDTETEQ